MSDHWFTIRPCFLLNASSTSHVVLTNTLLHSIPRISLSISCISKHQFTKITLWVWHISMGRINIVNCKIVIWDVFLESSHHAHMKVHQRSSWFILAWHHDMVKSTDSKWRLDITCTKRMFWCRFTTRMFIFRIVIWELMYLTKHFSFSTVFSSISSDWFYIY